MKRGNILIVGGAGFIGSHLNKMLNNLGYTTVVFDNLSRGDRATLLSGTFIEGDMGNQQALEQLFQKHHFDVVFHFAALIDVGESIHTPAAYYLNNVSHTLNLLRMMITYGIKYFVFSSTAAVYGVPVCDCIPESHSTLPINPYGHTKLMVETILRDFDRAYGLKSYCLRYFNAAGGDPEGQIKYYQKKPNNLIPIVLRSILNHHPVTIHGTDYPTPDGTCIRDYIHLDDLCQAHILAMQQLLQGGTSMTYNLGNGQGFSVREVLAAAEKVTGSPLRIIEGPRRAGDPPILVADASRAKRELGWTPKYADLETMIAHAWKAIGAS